MDSDDAEEYHMTKGDVRIDDNALPFDFDNEKEQLDSITELRSRIHTEDTDDTRFESVREERNIEYPQSKSHLQGRSLFQTKEFQEGSISTQQLKNENELLKENERLLRSRIETLEQIVQIQNDEIQKSLTGVRASHDKHLPRPRSDLPPYLREAKSVPDLFYRLLGRWRSKVHELLIQKKGCEFNLEKRAEESKSCRNEVSMMGKELQYVKRVKEQETESFELQLRIERRKNLLLQKKMDEINEQGEKNHFFLKNSDRELKRVKKILNGFFTTENVSTSGFNQQNQKFESILGQKLGTFSKRIEFAQNRVEMIKGVISKQLSTCFRKLEKYQKENSQLRENLHLRRSLSSKPSGQTKELISHMEKEVERLKHERNFLLTQKLLRTGTIGVQAGEDGLNLDEKNKKMESCLQRAENSLQHNLKIMIQLRKRLEEVNKQKELNEKEYGMKMKKIRQKLLVTQKKEKMMMEELMKRDRENKTLRKEMIKIENFSKMKSMSKMVNSGIRNPPSSVSSLHFSERYQNNEKFGSSRRSSYSSYGEVGTGKIQGFEDGRRRNEVKSRQPKKVKEESFLREKKKKPRERYSGIDVQDSVILKLNALNSITDQILNENLEEDETLFMK